MTYCSGIIAKCHYTRPRGVVPLSKSHVLTCATLDSASSTRQCNLYCARCQIQSPAAPTPSLHPPPVGVAASLVTTFTYQYSAATIFNFSLFSLSLLATQTANIEIMCLLQ